MQVLYVEEHPTQRLRNDLTLTAVSWQRIQRVVKVQQLGKAHCTQRLTHGMGLSKSLHSKQQ